MNNKSLTIAILEDNELDAFVLSPILLKAGYSCIYRDSVPGMLDVLKQGMVDAVILDWYLPDGDSFEVVQFIREDNQRNIPVIVVSADENVSQIVDALNAGADDFIQKPLTLKQYELLNILDKLLSKYNLKPASDLHFSLDKKIPVIQGNQLIFNQKTLQLTEKELLVIGYLLNMHGTLVYREDLFHSLWEGKMLSESKRLDSLIYRLRKKIKLAFGNAISLENEHGYGYRISFND